MSEKNPLVESTTAGLVKLGRRCDGALEAMREADLTPNKSKPEPIYNIAQAAKLLGKHTRTLMRHDQESDSPVRRNARGHREYTLADVHALGDAMGVYDLPHKRDTRNIVACASLKGGSGKSTSAVHLAIGAALRGFRVLLIDTDSQATATRKVTGLNPDIDIDPEQTIYGIISGERLSMRGLPVKTHINRLDCIPACQGLFAAEFGAITQTARERKKAARTPGQKRLGFVYYNTLKSALRGIREDYDLIVIDTPPSMSIMMHSVLVASDVLMVPVRPDSDDLASTMQYISLVSELAERIDAIAFRAMRFFVSQSVKSEATVQPLDRMYKVFGSLVMKSDIPMSAEIRHASNYMQSIYELTEPEGDRRTHRRAMRAMDDWVDESLSVLRGTWESKGYDWSNGSLVGVPNVA